MSLLRAMIDCCKAVAASSDLIDDYHRVVVSVCKRRKELEN